MRTIRCFIALAWFGLIAACGGGGGDSTAPPVGPPPAPAASADLTVTVADTLGRFVDAAAVTVASTGTTASTGSNGKATLKVPVGSEQVLTIVKSGFAEQVRVLTLDATATQGSLTTLIVAREPAMAIAGIEAGGSASGKHGVKVEFPAGALVNAGGQAVSGSIDMFMTPLDISISDVRAFPGAFEGTATGTARGSIVSFGTSELVPQQGGQKLQLAAGKTATIELPIYATTLLDGTPIHVGDTIPFWTLDSATGLWVQEGSGTVVARPASPTGLALRATITHFSWWNVDQFAQRATVNITVNVVGSSVPAGTRASVQAQVVSGSGPASTASTDVTVGVASSVQVVAPATLKFSINFDLGAETCNGNTSASVTSGATVSATISATCVQVPTPTIVAPSETTSTNSSAPTRVQIVLDSNIKPDSVQLLANGTVVQTFGPQFFYVALLDTAALPEGTTTLQARATLNGSTRGGNSVDLLIDRTRPQARQIAPVSTASVNRDTSFAVVFDERVMLPRFALPGEVVKLTVTLPGQSPPIQIDADIAFDNAGTTLTVTPRVDLPLGIAGLSWGGLQDAAGNAITGTVAATWDVDRSQRVGPNLPHVFQFGNDLMAAALTIGTDGSLLAAHRPAPGDKVSLSRYNSETNTWVALASAVNDRPTQNLMTLAVDNNGVPHVAFAQQTAADPLAFELVLKRFNGTGMELAAPIVPLVGARGIDISQGALAFDGSNRAVLTFSDPNDSNVRVFRLEQGSLVSLATVTLAFDPHLALQADDTPLVAFVQGAAGSNAGVLRVGRVANNGAVQLLGGTIDSVPNASESIGQPRIVIRGTEPWVFWVKNRLTHAARFDGTNWIEMPFDAPVNGTFGIDAAVLNGDVVIAASGEAAVVVLRLRNGGWEAGFDATTAGVRQARLQLAVRGSSVALMSTVFFPGGTAAEVQRLLFP